MKAKKDIPLNDVNDAGQSGVTTSTTSEHATLVKKSDRLPDEKAVRLRLGAIIVSWISIISLFVLGVTTFILSVLESSSASFAFGLDAILDCLTSVVVLWRFQGSPATLYSPKRERIACLIIGILFMLSFIAITVKAIISLVTRSVPRKNSVIWYAALVNGVFCSCLAVAKFTIGTKLDSKSLITDAVNSLVGALMAFSIVASNVAYDENSNVWYLDSTVGIICSVVLLGYGIRLVVESLSEKETAKDESPET